jgi:CDP-4-dehydro-6-deoxyglucose reductase
VFPKPRRRPAALAAASSLSPSVRLLVLRVTDGEPFDFVAGQWVDLELEHDGTLLKRPYSIASAPADEAHDQLEIAVTHVDGGPASSALHALPVGASLTLVGPSGLFTRDRVDPALPSIFVGTGTGVTPLRAMIRDELRRASEGGPITLLFGCRTEADLLFRGEFEDLARRHPRFRYVPTLSRGDEAWTGRRGHVQSHLPELLAGTPDAHVFVCGLTPMVTGVRTLLKEQLGFDRRQVHSERYD